MGKYLRKSKTKGDVSVIEVSQSSLGVRTRARTLALQRSQVPNSPLRVDSVGNGGSYLQLRSRRLEKLDFTGSESKRNKHGGVRETCGENPNPNKGNLNLNSNSPVGSGVRLNQGDSGSPGLVSVAEEKYGIDLENRRLGDEDDEALIEENNHDKEVSNNFGVEGFFGENNLEIEGRERTTRESTPCNLIRDPDLIRTPGSSTKPTTTSTVTNRRQQSGSSRPYIPTALEMDEFFAAAEKEQQRQFIEKYNFDPVNEMPLPGRYEWEKVGP